MVNCAPLGTPHTHPGTHRTLARACSQDLVPRYRIAVSASGLVRRSVQVIGTFFTPYDFRAYPMEHQHVMLAVAVSGGLGRVPCWGAQRAGLQQ